MTERIRISNLLIVRSPLKHDADGCSNRFVTKLLSPATAALLS